MKKFTFIRQKSLIKKLEKVWRAPKGRHSKLRRRKRGKGRLVSIGYKKSKPIEIKSVSSVKDLRDYGENVLTRLAGNVGARKKLIIVKEAKVKGIKLDNVKDYDAFIKKFEDNLKKRKDKSKIKAGEKKKANEKVEKKESKEEKDAKLEEDKRKALERK